jgi:purine catabolism regulator
MAIYIDDLQNLAIFKNSIDLLAGKTGKNKKVQFITIMEVDDFAEFHLGEELFVLTTFSTCANDPKKMENILFKLIQKKISGIGIKVNRFLKSIPETLINLAEQYSTPLFLIEKEIPFRTIISDVTSLIISQQFETIKDLNNQYEEFYTSILKGEDLSFFQKKIGQTLSCNCFSFSHTGELLDQYIQTTPQNTEKLLDFIHLLNTNPEMIWQLINSERKYIIDSTGYFYIFPCIAYNKTLGYFVVQQLNNWDSDAMMHIKQIISFLSIKLMEDALKKESETKFQIQLANEIFYNTSLDEDAIKGKLSLMGLTPDEYYNVLFIEPTNQIKPNYNIINSNYLKKKISLFVEGYLKNYLISDVSEGYCLILTFNNRNRFHDYTIFSEFLNNLAKIIEIPCGFTIGCSQKKNQLTDITDALKLSKRANLLGKEIYPEKNIYLYDDFFEIQIIMSLLNTKEHELIRSHIIAPLEKYDQKYKSYLLETLETCIKAATLQEASKKLFIHNSTLRYRLEKINELTGKNFFTNIGRYSLINAFLLMKLEKIFGPDT